MGNADFSYMLSFDNSFNRGAVWVVATPMNTETENRLKMIYSTCDNIFIEAEELDNAEMSLSFEIAEAFSGRDSHMIFINAIVSKGCSSVLYNSSEQYKNLLKEVKKEMHGRNRDLIKSVVCRCIHKYGI